MNRKDSAKLVCFAWLAPLLLCAGEGFGQKQIYWTNNQAGTIGRANLDGSGSIALISGLADPAALDVDLLNGKIYWTEGIPGTESGKIRRANLDGTNVQDVVTRFQNPNEVVVDHVHNKVWWSEARGTVPSRIARSNFDGSGVEEVYQNLDGFVNNVLDLVLDLEHDQMYWPNRRGRLQRASLAGTGVIDLPINPHPENPRSIAIDFHLNRIYWAEDAPDAALRGIRRAHLDGTSNETIAIGVPDPNGLELDLDGGKIYWSEPFGIRRANLDGSNPELLFSRVGEPFATDVEVVPEPTFGAAALAGVGLASARRHRRRRPV